MLPDVNAAELRAKLKAGRRFVRIKRELTPKQQEEIHELGLPGLAFIDEYRRVYPMGATASHVVGLVDVDSKGLVGHREVHRRQSAAGHVAPRECRG